MLVVMKVTESVDEDEERGLWDGTHGDLSRNVEGRNWLLFQDFATMNKLALHCSKTTYYSSG